MGQYGHSWEKTFLEDYMGSARRKRCYFETGLPLSHHYTPLCFAWVRLGLKCLTTAEHPDTTLPAPARRSRWGCRRFQKLSWYPLQFRNRYKAPDLARRRMDQFVAVIFKRFDSVVPRNVVAAKRNVVDAFAVLFQELFVDIRAG